MNISQVKSNGTVDYLTLGCFKHIVRNITLFNNRLQSATLIAWRVFNNKAWMNVGYSKILACRMVMY